MIDLHATPLSLNDPPDLQDAVLAESTLDSGSFVFRDESILGTRMQINLVARNYSDALAAALNTRAEIDRQNTIFNHRLPNSELSLLNRSAEHRASPELFAVVAAAERWRIESNSAFSGRLGRAIELWSSAYTQAPSRAELERLADAAENSMVGLDVSTRTITRPEDVQFSLDALAKGWIVDRAFEVARSAPGISGALVDIGGDIRCGGRSPDSQGWCVGIPDATIRLDNAPLAAIARLSNYAFATSGRGSRDRLIDGVRYSPTLSPQDGWPVDEAVSVSVAALSTVDADAIATVLMTLPKDAAIAWAQQHNVAARIQTRDDVIWTQAATSGSSQLRFTPIASPRANTKNTATISWPKDWSAYITFTAPPRQLVRDHNFRSPFMAMWVTDVDNKPVRTLLLV
ncbi:MAG TPA: FAD:protein FMN transferase, partial [Steroidobacteraceae bacterium]|nr:FAD:protein FMN transferase [Steroidobacteraceae bacterium]